MMTKGQSSTTVDETAVRETFGLPPEIPDETVNRGVDDAIVRGDLETARDRLAETVPTVCERSTPSNGADCERPVRCHRYDPSVDAEPWSWPRSIDGDDG